MKLKYIGKSFGVTGLTNGKIYECLAVDPLSGWLRIIDDGGRDPDDPAPGYLYSPITPGALTDPSPGGRWEIIEDDKNGTLAKAIQAS